MNVKEKLVSARVSLDPVLGRKRPTTETELDECAQALEEISRACGAYNNPEIVEFLRMVRTSLDVVSDRIRNRRR